MKLHEQHRHTHRHATTTALRTPTPSTPHHAPRLLLSSSSFISIVLFTFLQSLTTCAAKTYPCPYSQTVNITDGLRLKDGSYSFEGLVIPANLTAEYKIKIIDGIEYSAAKHWRGCACLLKPCVTFCCPPKMHYDEKHQNCSLNEKDSHSQHSHIEVTFANGTTSAVNIKDTFIVRYEFGCKNKIIERKRNEFWKWDLFENGTLKRDGRTYSTDEYCFTPLENKKAWSLTPLTCERFKKGFRVWIYAICTSLAIIINIGIILMFVAIKDVRNSNYGEGLIFHLFSLTMGLCFLVYLHLKNPLNLSHTACRNIGFLAYFFIIVSFLILNIISGSFWAIFSLKPIKTWYLKVLYGLTFAVGLAMKYVVKAVQDSSVGRHLKPGIGEDFCWFDTRLWGILLYLYIPIVISMAASLFCSARAYFRIFQLPSDTQMVAGKDFKITKTHFISYCIYILVVFSIWMREMIVYVTARIREHFFIIDYWSGICVLSLACVGFVFLLYKNKFVQKWWSENVTGTAKDTEYDLTPDYSFLRVQNFKKSDATDNAENGTE
ncbi:probable G-protein coupled receptor Mth-like 9 [Musca vetustissima]|uniref:probable G-protein coupled receptor Mth-like 9 n=1 Tax=Musca vetustissima TaxID=27455 RepID=UPI002AB7A281|nr:probable G-protein coupled receptor Mth-like 9 [Musca vetustissima]